MEASILASTKKVLGLPSSFTEFDEDILQHVNSALGTLVDLGVFDNYPEDITDDEVTWSQLGLARGTLNRVKTYVYLRVRLLFDPPGTSYHLTAMENQIKELEYRLNLEREVNLNETDNVD